MKINPAKLTPPAVAWLAYGLGVAVFAQDTSSRTVPNDPGPQTNLPTLTQVEQVRRLSLPEAKLHYPVKLHGVVLDYSSLPTLFISDQTGGIYVKLTGDQSLAQGQIIDIDGVSDAGKFAPMVVPSSVRAVGAGELPLPREVTFQRIASGVDDSQWVKVAGVVRTASMQTLKRKASLLKLPVLTIATEDGGRLDVLVDDNGGKPLNFLVDEEVAITGIAESIYNGKRQLINVRLLSPGTNFIEVRRAASLEVWTTPAQPLGSLRQFSLNKPAGHRVKVKGIVTLQEPGERVFIQDETGSLRVETRQKDTLLAGDRVEVLGFPAAYDYMPVMEDAVFHKIGSGPPPAPIELTAKEAQQRDHDADLIQVNAELLDEFATPEQLTLVMRQDDILFRAQLTRSRAASLNIRVGAQLRVTGICLAQYENFHSPRPFQMVLRSPTDVVVVRQASWWTPQRMGWALCILTGVLIGAGIWVWTLKQRVNAQTRAIREKIEREAILQERMRIAREFHDSLEQELAGVRMQIELAAATAATAPGTVAASLQVARTMICHSETETRRSIWELRSQVLENRAMPAALSAVIRSNENGVPIDLNVSGEEFSLPPRIESNLLRIAQEAITNAIRHAQPRHIAVHLAYENRGARLKISDDGCGFSAKDSPDDKAGHFGLLGMKERAVKIGGTLRIASTPGQGTCIEIYVPRTGIENKASQQ